MADPTTGWEPETPDEDTLLRAALYNFTDFNVGTAGILGARLRSSDWLALADLGRPGAFFNNATFLRPTLPGQVPFLLDEIEAFFSAEGSGDVDVWSAWPTPEVSERGWELQGYPPLLLRPAGGRPAPAPEGLEIREVRTADDVREFERVLATSFGQPDPPRVFDERLLGVDRVHMWIGFVDDDPVATAAVCTTRGLNGVQTIATLPGYRGRGLGKAMTWVATMAEPDLPAVLLSSDLGRPVYERMGYLPILRFSYWKMPR
ncbi:MAG: GNAT family N-acetyltransferase [Actinomycetota bacterium]